MRKIYLFLLPSFVLLSVSLNAQWNTDPTTRNPICIEPGTQTNQQLCSDGANGAYIVWEDLRGTLYAAIYAQWIDSSGNVRWAPNGIPVSDTTITGSSTGPSIAPDGANGAIIVWSSNKSAFTYTYAQRIGTNGNFLWQNNVQVDTINNSHSPAVIPDGHGGAIINWYSDDTVIGQYQLFIQWLDNTGRALFPQGGLQVSFDGVPHSGSKVATDNNYNAYIIFGEGDTLRVVKVDSSGNFEWGQSGKVLSTTYDNYSTHYTVYGDATTGIITAWSDVRNVPTRDDLYAQRLDTTGNFLWGANAMLVDSTDSISHTFISASPDGTGGGYLCFGAGNLYAERITGAGSLAWNAPLRLDTTSSGESYPSMAADGYNGIIVAWDDQRNGTSVYGQRIDSSGNYLWADSGVAVYTGYIDGVPTGTQIISLYNGYAIAAMSVDSNDNTTGPDIFAARFNGQADTTTSVRDLTGNMEWNIYPNPTTGPVYLRNNSSTSDLQTLQVYNDMGQLLNEQKLPSSPGSLQTINLQPLPDGLYFLKLTSENSFSTVRIVKQG